MVLLKLKDCRVIFSVFQWQAKASRSDNEILSFRMKMVVIIALIALVGGSVAVSRYRIIIQFLLFNYLAYVFDINTIKGFT